MKQKRFKKAIALLLLGSMLSSMAVSANAGWIGSFEKTEDFYKTWDSYLKGLLEEMEERKNTDDDVTEGETVTEETETATDTETTDSSAVIESDMTVIEDATTVENGEMLRASTYVLESSDESNATLYADSGTTLKYFPITLYDYDTDTINNATHQVEVDEGLSDEWKGLYFSGGNPAAESYTYTTDESAVSYSPVTVSYDDSWNPDYSDYTEGNHYYLDNGTYRVVTELDCARSGNWSSGYTYTWTITAGGNSYSASGSSITLYTQTNSSTVTTASLEYADWNWWNKGSGNNANGQKFYTGLVESTLTANKDIVFKVPDAGIFNSDATIKKIYTNVELPFVYDTVSKYYTFDASQDGVYFHEDSTQGSSGTAASNSRLYFNGDTQSNGGSYGDGSTTVWAPFNDGTSFSESTMNYHFGMNATVPFTMTANGRINESDESSKPIEFTFSGDDDVWVFIDGQLVIDLGGIHNRLDASINFAENTVTYSHSNTADADGDSTIDETGSYNNNENNEEFELIQTLFGGLISQDRATFAASDSHELTIFYLERGKGSSNSQIKFNLPVKDSVTVQKIIDEEAIVDEDGNMTFTALSEDADMTQELMDVLNNLDFGFTIYKDGAVLSNTTYNLLNVNGQVIATPSTDANGHFTLKNGQTAKFVGEFDNTTGNTYYVVEDIQDGFIYTTTSATYETAGSSSVTNAQDPYSYYKLTDDELYFVTNMTYNGGAAGKLYSDTVNVIGGSEAEDSLAFVFENYMNASLPRPSAIPNDDKIVIDYGLPVVISPVDNDLYLAENYTVAITGTPTYGTIVECADDLTKFIYTPTSQMTGVEKIAYTMTATAGTGEDAVTASGTAYIYIIPATTMYYEENFGIVKYKGNGWLISVTDSETGEVSQKADIVTTSGTSQYQEPGVVGTPGDSPYGSDAAYLDDSYDSNGTSIHADTTNSAVQFSYTFSGTGTSFYARTSSTTGYMRVVVTDASGEEVDFQLRDTVYQNSDTLYNIPVYSTEHLGYGTYTVTVTVFKADGESDTVKLGYGKDFWFDGIRIYEPLDPNDTDYSTALTAYNQDEEANMTHVTLRNKLLGEADLVDDVPVWSENGGFVLFTDTNGAMTTAEEYESIGPKEEVYLYDGQAVTFSLYDWDPNTNKIYLGMKAPTGTGTVTIGSGNTLELKNAVDCYYDITNYGTIAEDSDTKIKTVTFTITAAAGSLISVTNIKVTGDAEFTIIDQKDVTSETPDADDGQ